MTGLKALRRSAKSARLRSVFAVAGLLAASCGASYDDPHKCDVFDSSTERLAACMANTPPYYCGGDSGFPGGGTTLHGEAHYTRYQNNSDHVCSKAEMDAAKIAPEVRPASQR